MVVLGIFLASWVVKRRRKKKTDFEKLGEDRHVAPAVKTVKLGSFKKSSSNTSPHQDPDYRISNSIFKMKKNLGSSFHIPSVFILNDASVRISEPIQVPLKETRTTTKIRNSRAALVRMSSTQDDYFRQQQAWDDQAQEMRHRPTTNQTTRTSVVFNYLKSSYYHKHKESVTSIPPVTTTAHVTTATKSHVSSSPNFWEFMSSFGSRRSTNVTHLRRQSVADSVFTSSAETCAN